MSKKPHYYRIKNQTFRNLVRRFYYGGPGKNRTFLLKKMPKNSICTEIGVRGGDFSELILTYTKPKKLYLIDSWAGNEFYSIDLCKENYEITTTRFANNDKVEIIKSDSVKAIKQFPDSFFDWVYIDADHSYQGCKNDLESSFQTVKNNGFICGDNYQEEYQSVIKAVDDFIRTYPVTVIKFKNNQFILQKLGSVGN